MGIRLCHRGEDGRACGKREVRVQYPVDERYSSFSRLQDEAHSLPTRPHDLSPDPATRIRLIYALLTSPPIQHGLGITPGEGRWSRVKSIAALHDDQANKSWLKQWATGDWKLGLLKGLDSEHAGLGSHVSLGRIDQELKSSNLRLSTCTLTSSQPTPYLSSLSH